jgi:ABC-2 type transport system permease protein
MSWVRIKALVLQELFVTRHSVEILIDIFVFPLMSIVVFGFLSLFLSGTLRQPVAYTLLTGILLWEIVTVLEYSVTVGSLWNIWSKNLTNIFITPISMIEYMISQTLSGILKSITIFCIGSLLSIWLFHFNIYTVGVLNLLLYIVNLMIFAFSLGLVILGLIFRYGTSIQAFAWGIPPLLQPLTAVFYPVSVLPQPLQRVAWAFPPTYIFEAARINIVNPQIQWNLIGTSFGINIIFVIFSCWYFSLMFRKSKASGQFARLDG